MAHRDPEARREYARRWRAAHPGHRRWDEHSREVRRAWRASPAGKAARRAQEARARARRPPAPLEELPAPYTGHELFEAARQLVGEPPYFDLEVWEDRMGAVVLELLARGRRRDPAGALERHNRQEARHRVAVSLEEQLEVRPWALESMRPLTA